MEESTFKYDYMRAGLIALMDGRPEPYCTMFAQPER